MTANRPSGGRRSSLTPFVFGVMLAGAIPSASAQPSPLEEALSGEGQFGFHLFQLLLEQKGLRTITDFDEAVTNQPTRTVMVLAGNLDAIGRREWREVFTFIERGGSVLVASDRDVRVPGLFRIKAGPVEFSEQNAYEGYRDCPVVEEGLKPHALTRNVRRIVANRTGWISTIWESLGPSQTIATLPRFRQGDQSFAQGGLIEAIETENPAPGRLLLVADHSLFVNGMLWHGSNSMLAINTVDWLCHARSRRKLYFSVNGVALRSGIPVPAIPPGGIPPGGIPPEALPKSLEDVPPFELQDLIETPPESLITFGNSLLRGLEQEDVFDQLLAHQAADLPRDEYRQQLYLSIAAMAGYWLLRQLIRRSRPMEALVSRSVAPPTDARVQGLVDSGHLLQPLRELARDLFRTLAGSDDPAVWSAWRLTSRISGLRRLELIACDVDRRPVSRRQFCRLAKKIEQVRQSHQVFKS